MRAPSLLRPHRGSPRLAVREEEARRSFWTEAVAPGTDPVYGERLLERAGRRYRSFEPARSKLAAALARGHGEPIPRLRERWLYLGAATGTTVSHVADLVGPDGQVYAVEKSLRPFARLLALAERYPNVYPVLADARRTEGLYGLVPMVDGVYADLAQPDQVEIVREAAREFLREGGRLLFMLKTASMGREDPPESYAARAVTGLAPEHALGSPLRLEPFYRRHYLIAGSAFRPTGAARPARRPGPSLRLRRVPLKRRAGSRAG